MATRTRKTAAAFTEFWNQEVRGKMPERTDRPREAAPPTPLVSPSEFTHRELAFGLWLADRTRETPKGVEPLKDEDGKDVGGLHVRDYPAARLHREYFFRSDARAHFADDVELDAALEAFRRAGFIEDVAGGTVVFIPPEQCNKSGLGVGRLGLVPCHRNGDRQYRILQGVHLLRRQVESEYSPVMTPQQIEKLFPQGWATLRDWLKNQRIRNIRFSEKAYRIHKGDLPSA